MSVSTLLTEQPAAPSASMDIGAMLGDVRRRWKLIAVVPLFVILAAYGYLAVATPRYRASAQILVFDPQQPSVSAVGQEPASARAFDAVALNTEIEVIKSDSLSLRVAKDLKLYDNPEFQLRGRLAVLLDKLGVSHLKEAVPTLQRPAAGANSGGSPGSAQGAVDAVDPVAVRAGEAAAILREHIKAERVPLSYVLDVSATASNAETARLLASTLVSDYLADRREASQRALAESANWLRTKLADLKTRILETGTAIERLKAESGISDAGKGSFIEQQVADLNAQLMLVRADVAAKHARLELARQRSGSGSGLLDMPEAAASPVLNQLRLQQSVLTRQAAQLRARLGDRHEQVAAADAQLSGINRAIADETARITADLQDGYELALRRQQSLEANLQRLVAAEGNSSASVKLQELQRVADADGKLYDNYLSRYNEVETSKSVQSPGARIISPAKAPLQPSFPPRNLILVGAGAFGVALGLALAVAVSYLQAGVNVGDEAERTFGYPIIGTVPDVRDLRSKRSRRAAGDGGLAQAILRAALIPVVERVRAVRIGLRLPSVEHAPKVILVTSSLAGEGTSTLATLLAASSSSARQSTVLIDGDVRRRATSTDASRPHPGLTELLSGSVDLAAVLLHDRDTGCDVVPAGMTVQSPGDLLASPRMIEVITRLRGVYDCIVIDTPPLLSVVDALSLATMADKILVVVDAGFGHHSSVIEALRLLRPHGHRIAGIVFNRVTPQQFRRIGHRQEPPTSALTVRSPPVRRGGWLNTMIRLPT